MSLMSLAAPLIRLAAADEGYEQELFNAVHGDNRISGDLIHSAVGPHELTMLTSTEWQWYATWRQAHGGVLEKVVLDHLTDSASTRFARFQVHELVLHDPETNASARRVSEPPDWPDAIGLKWLSDQAHGARLAQTITRIASTRGVTEDELFELFRDEAFELMRDALQCATEASWFLLRQLTSVDVRLGDLQIRDLVSEWLREFGERRGLDREITARWFGLGEPA